MHGKNKKKIQNNTFPFEKRKIFKQTHTHRRKKFLKKVPINIFTAILRDGSQITFKA